MMSLVFLGGELGSRNDETCLEIRREAFLFGCRSMVFSYEESADFSER